MRQPARSRSRVVRLVDGCGHQGRQVGGEEELRLAAVADRQTLERRRAAVGVGAAVNGVEGEGSS
eukprot:3283094-Pleurochrysis_carterae.AAC.4